MNCAGGAGTDAHAALDALAVAHFRNVHGAGFDAGVAVGAKGLIHADAEEGDRVKEGIDGAQGAQEAAEGAEAHDAQNCNQREQQHLPGEEGAGHSAQEFVFEGERQTGFEGARGADEFAEAGREFPKRNQDDEDGEKDVFQVGEDAGGAALANLRRGELVQKLLQKTHRAEKTADKAAQEEAHQKKRPQNIVGEAVAGVHQGALQTSERARRDGPRAGVAVQARSADAFEAPFGNLSLGKSPEITVVQHRCHQLGIAARALRAGLAVGAVLRLHDRLLCVGSLLADVFVQNGFVVVVGTGTDQGLADDTVYDNHGVRNIVAGVVFGDAGSCGAADQRLVIAVFLDELGDGSALVTDAYKADGKSGNVFFCQLHKVGHFGYAGAAPGRPEIQKDNFVVVVRHAEGCPVVHHEAELRGHVVCGQFLRASVAGVRVGAVREAIRSGGRGRVTRSDGGLRCGSGGGYGERRLGVGAAGHAAAGEGRRRGKQNQDQYNSNRFSHGKSSDSFCRLVYHKNPEETSLILLR